MIRNIIIAAAALATCSVAQADVVYEWQPSTAGNVGPFSASLTVTDAAYLSGGLRETYTSANAGTTQLVRFALTPADGAVALPLSIDFQRLVVGGSRGDPQLNWNLDFRDDGTLAGGFDVSDDRSNYRFVGSGAAWEITQFSADNVAFSCDSTPSSGGGGTPCTDAGIWLVDASTIPADGVGQVPEPGILPLMALASVGLGLSLRKRRQ